LEYIAGEINRVTSENEKLKRDLGRLKKEVDDLLKNKPKLPPLNKSVTKSFDNN